MRPAEVFGGRGRVLRKEFDHCGRDVGSNKVEVSRGVAPVGNRHAGVEIFINALSVDPLSVLR